MLNWSKKTYLQNNKQVKCLEIKNLTKLTKYLLFCRKIKHLHNYL